ncbi:efflux RND transporter permease subunit, partial [Myxococcota bacterium]|nr:efflux RND transporter permease subunit [Myxococcota bacterium]
HGIAASTVNDIIQKAVGGHRVTEIYKGNMKIPVMLRLPAQFRSSVEALGRLVVKTPTGGSLRLRDIVQLRQVDGPLQITREDGKRQMLIQCNVVGRDIVGFVNELKQEIANNVVLPSGYFVSFGGQFENQKRATDRILITGPLAIGLIFLLLFLIFKSLSQSLLIMGTIPLAFIGGIVLLYATGFYLSISASLGFIALFGISIENSIVLINYFNQLRQEGHPLEEAVVMGSKRRLRPVLMTTILTMLGLVPIWLATGPGSEIQKPLAVVVFGGVFSSMVLTLIILPALYVMVESRFDKQSSIGKTV